MEKRKRCFDQVGRSIAFDFPPQRIISLVPSQTELLFDLGVGDRVVGITKFCVHPSEWCATKPKVGGTKNVNLDAIAQLKPDLIIGNKEENDEECIRHLSNLYPVWMSDIVDWPGAMQMVITLGEIVNASGRANDLVSEIESRFKTIRKFEQQKTLYLIWKKPWMAAGKNTFIDCMLSKIGLANSVAAARYPNLTNEQIKDLSPELVLLSSEPYPFKGKHIQELRTLLPAAKIILVDGEMFSWYGSRLLKAPDYFSSLVW